jgi:hypothetical protein
MILSTEEPPGMKPPFPEFAFPGLEPQRDPWLLAADLRRSAFHIKDGRSIGIRNIALAVKCLKLRQKALLARIDERLATMQEKQAAERTGNQDRQVDPQST